VKLEALMELSIQTVLLNVRDLEQSIEFYQDVFDLRLASRKNEVAALMVYEADRRQVLLLRELRSNSHHGGRRSIGLRMVSFEVGTPSEFDAIERNLVDRDSVVWQGHTESYRAIMAVDPDRTEICVASSLTGTPISSEDWNEVDDAIYMMG
jgi:catechol-2,3-dioxygenase